MRVDIPTITFLADLLLRIVHERTTCAAKTEYEFAREALPPYVALQRLHLESLMEHTLFYHTCTMIGNTRI